MKKEQKKELSMSSNNITLESELSFNLEQVDLTKLDNVFNDLKLTKPIIVYFVDDEEMIQLNKEVLNHDFYTDIITFDYTDDIDITHSELVVSVDRVKENAANLQVDFIKELYRVCIHGMLHITGLDDQTNEQKQKMRNEEDRLLILHCST